MKYLFVINPVAGGKDKSDFLELLRKESQKSAFSYEVLLTEGKGDENRLRWKLSKTQPDRVAAVGGDGTVQLVGKVLEKRDCVMGVIPFGSANGLATELAIPNGIEASLKLFLEPTATLLIDMIRINDEYCCLHFADIGMNAAMIRDFERDRQRGMFTYAKYFIQQLERREEQEFDIQLDGRRKTYTGVMLALANARRLGTGVVLNRCGNISDGRFEVVVIKEVHFGDLIKAGWSMLDPEIEYGDAVECLSCRQAAVKLSTSTHLQIDGELVGEVEELHARIVPEAIRIIVPQ